MKPFPKDQIKVLLLENINQSAVDLFAGETYQVEQVKRALSEDELVAKLPSVHVLGIRSKTQLTARALAASKGLLAIGCFCIGTNQVDLGFAKGRALPVFNAPFSNTRSVAELMIGEIVMLARCLGDRSREVHEGMWKKSADGCSEVRGKTLGIIGYGHIGRQLGVLAESFGMKVVYYDILTQLPMGNNRASQSMNALLAVADFVTLHVPETPQTRNMVTATEIGHMKRGAYLLNASRGNVVDLDALADAIKRGHLAGAAVDVYPEEPQSNGPGFQSPLRGLPNVILTPHIGGSTAEAQEAIGREVATSLIKFVNAGATTGAVNFPQVELPQSPGTHRILNMHRNVPGVLRDINKIVSDLEANIHTQMLATDPDVGYLIMDIDQVVSVDVRKRIAALDTSIRTRMLY